MRKRVMLIAAPLLLVAIAAGVAVAAPSDAEHSHGRRLDNPHVVRPIAASTSTASSSPAKSALSPQDATRVLDPQVPHHHRLPPLEGRGRRGRPPEWG